jgi:hypothetical protein
MDQIGERLDTIPDLNVAPYEADDISVPAALVSLPANIDYLTTNAQGVNEIDVLVSILVSEVGDKIRRDQIAPYGDGDDGGPKSIKRILEAGNGSYTAFSFIKVKSGGFTVVSIANINYLGFLSLCHVVGSGRR